MSKNYSTEVYSDYSKYDVAKLFGEIENDLMANMARNLSGHKQDEKAEGFKWSMWQAEKAKSLQSFIKENKSILKGYDSRISEDIDSIMQEQFEEGAKLVDKEVNKAISLGHFAQAKGSSSDFFKINERKIKSLINSVQSDMRQAQTATLRKTNDVYRKVIFDAEMYAATGTKTVNQCIDLATQDFYKRGINCIRYSNGNLVDVAKYAEMAIRTANKRAFLTGEGAMRDNWGEHLVYMSRYGQCSPKCLPYQGKVYIDDVYSHPSDKYIGQYQSKGYTLLSKAIEGGAFHPNCKHTLSTFFEDVNELPDEQATEINSVDIMPGVLETSSLIPQNQPQKEGLTKEEQKVKLCQNEADGWNRVSKYALDDTNKVEAKKKAKAYERKAKIYESGISSKRKTADNNNQVDLEYLNSAEYKAKFDNITNDKSLNNSLYKYSKAILTHRNKTNKEDLYLIDSLTGKLFGSITNSKTDYGVKYTNKIQKKLQSFSKGRLISIHNHPTNNPPTGSDFGSAGANGYKIGVVVCHNGKVFTYRVGDIPFTSNSFDKYVDSYIKKGYNEIEAIEETLNYYKERYGIDWSEL
jgi:hypothetical protein